jgi:hypothetical protein
VPFTNNYILTGSGWSTTIMIGCDMAASVGLNVPPVHARDTTICGGGSDGICHGSPHSRSPCIDYGARR